MITLMLTHVLIIVLAPLFALEFTLGFDHRTLIELGSFVLDSETRVPTKITSGEGLTTIGKEKSLGSFVKFSLAGVASLVFPRTVTRRLTTSSLATDDGPLTTGKKLSHHSLLCGLFTPLRVFSKLFPRPRSGQSTRPNGRAHSSQSECAREFFRCSGRCRRLGRFPRRQGQFRAGLLRSAGNDLAPSIRSRGLGDSNPIRLDNGVLRR
jgi:hypothetical protein